LPRTTPTTEWRWFSFGWIDHGLHTYICGDVWFMWQTAKRKPKHEDEHEKRKKMCSIRTWETRLGKFRRGWLSKLGVFKAAGPTFISACP